jgi:hypothetical protein
MTFSGTLHGVSPGLSAGAVIISGGVASLDPGREYWVTNTSVSLILSGASDLPVKIRNKSAGSISIQSPAHLFDIGGTSAVLDSGQTATVIFSSGLWLTLGLRLPIVTTTFFYTGSAQSYVVPSTIGSSLTLRLRGAGGGGSDLSPGGGSGATLCRLVIAASTNLASGQIAAGATLQVVVGRAGQFGGATANVFGGGRSGNANGGQGGDYSGVFLSSVSFANAIALAGGGGGACGGGVGRGGGGGGGTTGQSGSGSGPGTGGTQSAGGSSGGGQLTGGGGNPAGAGAGGGSGYYGGGATTSAGGGGGGSGYLPSGALSGSSTSAGSGQTTAALTGMPANTGNGGAAAENGQDGAVVIEVV